MQFREELSFSLWNAKMHHRALALKSVVNRQSQFVQAPGFLCRDPDAIRKPGPQASLNYRVVKPVDLVERHQCGVLRDAQPLKRLVHCRNLVLAPGMTDVDNVQ